MDSKESKWWQQCLSYRLLISLLLGEVSHSLGMALKQWFTSPNLCQ